MTIEQILLQHMLNDRGETVGLPPHVRHPACEVDPDQWWEAQHALSNRRILRTSAASELGGTRTVMPL